MRILFLESSQIWIYGLPQAFKDAGHHVIISGPLTSNNIPRMITELKPDLAITIGWGLENTRQKQKWIGTYVHEAGIPLVYWAVEDPAFTETWSLPLIREIRPDFVFTISTATVDFYRQQGIKAAHLPFGYHPSVHSPGEVLSKYQCSIAVVANAYPDILTRLLANPVDFNKLPNYYRLTSLYTLVRPLLAEKIRIDFWGRDWDQIPQILGVDIPPEWQHGFLPYKEARNVYSSADLVLGLQNYPFQVTQRTFEILASGGVLLTDDTPAVRTLFKPGKELIGISSPEETVKTVQYYLNSPEKRRHISAQGQLAVKQHSYRERVKYCLEILCENGIIPSTSQLQQQGGEIVYYGNYTDEKYHLYVVNPNDTLWSIAKKHQVTIQELMTLNDLTSDVIYVNQVLKISEIIDPSPYVGQNFLTTKPMGLPGEPQVTRWLRPVFQAAADHDIPWVILYSIMIAESSGNPNVVSSTGGIGLMQLQLETASWLGVNPCNPYESIDGAAHYLNELYHQFKDWKLTIAAYNAGPVKVKESGGVPAIDITQNYVKTVLSYCEAISQFIDTNPAKNN